MIKKQSLLARTMKARKQRGLSLAEAGLVLALGMLVAVIAFAGYSFGSNSIKTRNQSSATLEAINNIVRIFASAGDYTGLTPKVLIDSGMVPAGFRSVSSNNKIFNSWGGEILIAPVTPGNNTFTITMSDVPKASCVDYVTGVASIANSISVGTVTVKAVGGALNVVDLAAECNKGTTATVQITSS